MEETAHQRIIRLAKKYAELEPDQRSSFLDRECGRDLELREQVKTGSQDDEGSERTRIFSNDHEAALPGHYKILEMLGRGGMAEVFLAEDTRLSRKVAIKFLNIELRTDPERMKRFHQEARAASGLNHPNILIIHDIGESNGLQYIVSEFIDGETLSARIRRGRVSMAEAVEYSIQIASALAASHKAGIVHRDVKPDNVMVRRDGSIKVLDFGLAKDTGGGPNGGPDFDAATLDRELTSPGLILGTPQYMSPEQARGLPLDGRTDIFSLGIIIFEMAAGRPPFSGATMADIIAAILTSEPRRLEEFLDDPPVTLINIVEKALRKNRDERYLTMEGLLSDLKNLRQELLADPYIDRRTGGTEIRDTRQHTVRTAITRTLQNSKWVVAGILLVLVAGAAVWLYRNGPLWTARPVAGPMRTIPIASWSSGGSEFITTASFSRPDAKMVAYTSSQSGANEIWVKPSVGGDPIQVTKGGFYNQYPVWSPDGEEIAYFTSRTGARGIWKSAFTGGEQGPVASDIGPTARPVYWAKSGKIYDQDGAELFAVEKVGGNRIKVSDLVSQNIRARTIEISPDESTIAFSIKEGDAWKVKVQPLGTATPLEVASVKDQIDHIAWDATGREIFFSAAVEGSYQIFRVAPGRAAPTQISNGNVDCFVQDIASDDSRILYGSLTETSDLWSVNIQDSTESVVSNDTPAEYWADVSPDGKYVIFQSVKTVDRPYSGSIGLVGGERTLIVSPTGFAPSWSGNGQHFAFFRRSDAGFAIWRSEPGIGETIKLADGAILTPGYTASPYLKIGTAHISWSPDGMKIAYSARTDGFSNIRLVTSAGTDDRSLTANNDDKATYGNPIWSRDGSFLIFVSEHPSDTGERRSVHRIWQYYFENGEIRILYETQDPVRLLGVGGSDQQVVFTQKPGSRNLTDHEEASYVFVQSLKTGVRSRSQKLDHAYFHNIHLSRDGSSIAFVTRPDNISALWTVPVEGGTPKRIFV